MDHICSLVKAVAFLDHSFAVYWFFFFTLLDFSDVRLRRVFPQFHSSSICYTPDLTKLKLTITTTAATHLVSS